MDSKKVSHSTSLILLFCVALGFRAIILGLWGDAYYDTGRMVAHYNLAANFAQTGHFYTDDEFIRKANLKYFFMYPRRALDYNDLKTEIRSSKKLNTNPHISDTWGFAGLLGLIWKVTGDTSFLYLQIVQILIDSFCAVLIYLILIRLFGAGPGPLFAAYMYALFPTFAFLSVLPHRNYYAAWGILISLYFFIRGLDRNRVLNWLASGAVIALFSWFRPSIFILFIAYAAWILIAEKNRKIQSTFLVILCMGGMAFVGFFVPFSIHYHHRYGTYNFAGGVSGLNIWEGLGYFPNKYQFKCNDYEAFQRAVQLGYPPDSEYYTPQFGKILRDDALLVIKKDPLFYAETIVKRYARFFFAHPPFPMGEYYQISLREAHLPFGEFFKTYPLIGIEKIIKTVASYLLPLLALLAFLLYRLQWRSVLLLVALWQYRLFIFLGTILVDRYVVECYFPVVVLAGLSMARLGELYQARKGMHKPAL